MDQANRGVIDGVQYSNFMWSQIYGYRKFGYPLDLIMIAIFSPKYIFHISSIKLVDTLGQSHILSK